MSNLGMELGLKDLGIDFVRAKVGDRYVMQQLREKGWKLGGESSGHLICRDLTTTGDGIVAALQVLQAMQSSGKTLHELKNEMQKMPQKLINLRFANRVNLVDFPAIDTAVDAIEKRMGSRGRVLLRSSGTEPVVRVMVEGEDVDLVNQYAQELAHDVNELIK
jgi:phosphoglucosamine mutase